MPRSEILDVLSRKKRLSSKDFLKLYDFIWQNPTSFKYKNPDHVLRERLEMIKKKYESPSF